jgi:selenide,water dikinase
VLVSGETGDDAAVFALPGGDAVVATVDVFTPIVDDPYDWGRIAAANAMSDVYAMGGKPRFALNVAGWPVDELPIELLADVLRGGRDVAAEGGCAVVGGHTITTEREPLYGMAVLGTVDPEHILRNSMAAPGMTLCLTKPIGTGMIATAIKRSVGTQSQVASAIATMTRLNAAAAEATVAAGAEAATDVTGFGLLGHLRIMLASSGCAARVDASTVPLLPGVLALAQRDFVAAGTKRNHAWLQETTDWGQLTRPEQLVLADAQTSGGLLVATSQPDALLSRLRGNGVDAAEIGVTRAGPPGGIELVGRITE